MKAVFHLLSVMSLKAILFVCIPFGIASGYFDVELTEGRSLNGTGEVQCVGIKVKRVNKTLYGASGNLEVSKVIDDSFEVKAVFYDFNLILPFIS